MKIQNSAKLEQLSHEIGAENVPILLNIFLSELAQYIDTLSMQTDDSNNEYLKDICHALKSSAASFGAEKLCAMAIEIDTSAKLGQRSEYREHRVQLIALLRETQQCYHKLLASD
ncbi:Hpt domain-containing protein [Vibrio sinensis]|uniref:Phosphorelay protein LuxU n=1 Tax=Vibrio sinensis TaxID=2302434 RepID=A0A3A6QKC3_9VIBR|nr:quorum-sensing phosphorelay protein LuxU [Vibrio sinensis]RJX68473.1 Hpt domain-containing protein [Vibrio sinensis]